VNLRERTLTATFGGDTRVRTFTLGGEVRQTFGSLATDGSPFAVGTPGANGSPFVTSTRKQVRSITGLQASVSYVPRPELALQAQALGSYADLDSSPAIVSWGSNLGITWRVGRFFLNAQYQAYQVQIGDAPASLQHSFRTALSRPFDF